MKAIPCVSRKPLSVTNTLPKASVSPVYDDNGNLTSDGRWAYTWDGENRLSTMTTTTAAQSAGVPYCKLVFGYDWMGRRLRKLIYNISSPGADPSEDQRFLYDGWNLFTEYSVGGSGLALKRSYTWGLDLSGSEQGAGGVGGLRAVRVKNGSTFTTYAPCYDGNGNIVMWMNHGTGAVESRQEYDPFGNRIIQEGTELPIGFSTKYEDRETGLLYYGYRYYYPVTGRWPSRDPIGERGGVNLYGFVGNDGVSHWDEFGLRKNGHHIIPWSISNGKVRNSVQKFFDSDVARIFNEVYTTHNFKEINGISHRKYNELVSREVNNFLNGEAIEKMTKEAAGKFLAHIKGLPASHGITRFNMGIIDEAVDEITRKLGDEAAKAARTSIQSAYNNWARVAKEGSKKLSKKAGSIGVVVTAYFLAEEIEAKGVGNALFDEAADTVAPELPLPDYLQPGFMGTPIRVRDVRLILYFERKMLNGMVPKIMGAKVCGEENKIEFK